MAFFPGSYNFKSLLGIQVYVIIFAVFVPHRQLLSVRFGEKSPSCGDFRMAPFLRRLCGLVTALQKEECSVNELLNTLFKGGDLFL